MSNEILSPIGSTTDALTMLRFALCQEFEHLEDAGVLSNLLINRSISLFQAGKKEEAETLLREALYLIPKHPLASQTLCHLLYLKGVEQSKSGESDKTVAYLREALRLQSDHADAIRALGITLLNQAIGYFNSGQLDLADAILREVMTLLPEHSMATQAMIQTLTKKSVDHWQNGKLIDALDVLREALYLAPDNQVALFQLSRLAFEYGKTEEAVAFARRLLKLSPDNANYVGWACIVSNALGDMNGTEDLARRCIDLIKSGSQIAEINPTEIIRIYGEVLVNKRENDRCIAVSNELAQNGFHHTLCATLIADAYLAKGATEQALNMITPFASSSWSRTFVTASIAQFRTTLLKIGMELPTRLPGNTDPDASIAISSLSNYGRFGQQMSEYLLLYLYARKNGLSLETPEWVGHYFFDLDDPVLTPYRYVTRKGQGNLLRQKNKFGEIPPIVNVDIWSPGGYLENWTPGDPGFSSRDRDAIQSRLKPRQLWMPYLQPALNKLNAAGKTIVALHLRRGDRVAMNNITQTSLYLDWLAQIWTTLEAPILFLASDEIDSVKKDFLQYQPLSLIDLTEPWKNNEYLQDFYILMNCDILGISTGGFAANAALLNNRANLFVVPSSDNLTIVPFAPYGVQDI